MRWLALVVGLVGLLCGDAAAAAPAWGYPTTFSGVYVDEVVDKKVFHPFEAVWTGSSYRTATPWGYGSGTYNSSGTLTLSLVVERGTANNINFGVSSGFEGASGTWEYPEIYALVTDAGYGWGESWERTAYMLLAGFAAGAWFQLVMELFGLFTGSLKQFYAQVF